MTLSLISVLSQDVTALWLLLKTSAGVWAMVCCKRQGWGGLCMTIDGTRWARWAVLMLGSYCQLNRQGVMGAGHVWAG